MTIQKRLIPINFIKGGNKRLGVVIHTMDGYLDGTDTWFNNPASGVSSHYGVDLDGSRVYQWVNEADQSSAQGNVSKPTFRLVLDRPGINPNTFLISIECADNKNQSGADRSKQYPVVIELLREVCSRNNIPIDRDHICGHNEIRSTKTCPGNLDVDYIVREAQKGVNFPMQNDTIPVDKATFENLVSKSTKYDALVAIGISTPSDVETLRRNVLEANQAAKVASDEAKSTRDSFTDFKQKIAEALNSPQDLDRMLSTIAEVLTQLDSANKNSKTDAEGKAKLQAQLTDALAEVTRLKLLLAQKNPLDNSSTQELLSELLRRLTAILRR